MLERLQLALQHVDEVPPDIQRDIAEQIEAWTLPANDQQSVFGSVLLPDDYDEIEDVLKARHEVPPSPPLEEVW